MKISASSLNLFFRCPYAFLLKLEGKEVKPLNDSLIVGKVVHKALELFFTYQDDHIDLVDLTDQAYSLISEEVSVKSEILKDKIASKLEAYRPMAVKLLPKVDKVEHEFLVEYEDIQIHGFIDLLTRDRTIIDFKTTEKAMTKPSPEYTLQLSIYNVLGIADKFELHFITDTKYSVVPVNPLPTSMVFELIDKVKEAVELGVFVPSGLTHPYGCQYCSYIQHCKYKGAINV